MKVIYKIFKEFLAKNKENHISEYAAECAYFTILSFIPFVLFFITLIQFIGVGQELVFNTIKQLFPTSMHTFVLNIIQEIYSKTINTVSISLIVALWSASRGFYSLCKGLIKIYKLSDKKNNIVIRVEGFLYTIFLILALVFVMILLVFGDRIHKIVIKNFFSLGIVTSFFIKIRTFFIMITLFTMFLILYKFIPRQKFSIKSQIPGAIFSSISWIVTSYIFSIYVNILKGFSNTYGSLTSIILIMMWVYVCMYIILLGAEINMYIQETRGKN